MNTHTHAHAFIRTRRQCGRSRCSARFPGGARKQVSASAALMRECHVAAAISPARRWRCACSAPHSASVRTRVSSACVQGVRLHRSREWGSDPRDADTFTVTVPALETGAQRAPWRTAAAGHHPDSRRPDTHSECSTGNWWSANRASALINGEQTHTLPSRRKVQRIGCAHGPTAFCAYPLVGVKHKSALPTDNNAFHAW